MPAAPMASPVTGSVMPVRERLIVLRERRARLLDRAAGEREHLASVVQGASAIEPWVAMAQRFATEARRHPAWVIGALAFFVAMRPRRTFSLAMRGWSLFQIYRRGRQLWDRFGPAVLAGLRSA